MLRLLTAMGVCLAVMAGVDLLSVQPMLAQDLIKRVRGGPVQIQRASGQVETLQTTTTLKVGDLVFPEGNAIVRVRCQNQTVAFRRYVFGLSDVCPDSVAQRYSSGGRGSDDFLAFLSQTFAYATQVVEAQPLLRWHPVAGATQYQVQVFQGDRLVWQENVQAPQVVYGGEPLESGQRYQLIIEAITVEGRVDRSRLLLRRLSAMAREQVAANIAQLERSTLEAEALAIAQSRLYLEVAEPLTEPPEGAGLVWRAIDQLEPMVVGSQTPWVHRLLGDLYVQVGLLEQARVRYEQVLGLTRVTGDVASRAAAWVGLANLAAAGGDRVGARQRLQWARINYRVLGDEEQVAQIDQWLQKLE